MNEFALTAGEIMMTKLKSFLLILGLLSFSFSAAAETVSKSLPQPDIKGGSPLMQTLNNRRSTKVFSSKAIDNQTLSDILWAAWGINRKDGKRTVPTAMNTQNMRVYAIMEDGAWLYDANKNKLNQVDKEDLRPLLAQQPYAENAPLFLLYTSNGSGEAVTSAMHAGSMYQNVGLVSASKGLNNVVRGYFDKAGIAKALNINEADIIISQVVGWPK